MDLDRIQLRLYVLGILAGALLGLARPDLAPLLVAAVWPVLVVVLYGTFLQVPLLRLREAKVHGRFLAAALTVNFLAVPPLVWVLTRLLPENPALLFGVLLVLLAPCTDWVNVFNRLGRGDVELLALATPVLLLIQLLLLPLYLLLFLGAPAAAAIASEPFLHALAWVVTLPLALAALTQVALARRPAVAWTERMFALPVPLLTLLLFLVTASQVPVLPVALPAVAWAALVFALFLLLVPLVARSAARLFRLEVPAGRALVFSAGARNSFVVFPLALAAEAWPLAAAVIVVQAIVEMGGLLVYVRWVPSWILPDAPPG